MLHINDFILQAQQKGASDLHIVCGLPIKCRLDGKMQTLSDTVPTPQDCEVLAQELAGAQFETIRESGELDLALTADCGTAWRAEIDRRAALEALAAGEGLEVEGFYEMTL